MTVPLAVRAWGPLRAVSRRLYGSGWRLSSGGEGEGERGAEGGQQSPGVWTPKRRIMPLAAGPPLPLPSRILPGSNIPPVPSQGARSRAPQGLR